MATSASLSGSVDDDLASVDAHAEDAHVEEPPSCNTVWSPRLWSPRRYEYWVIMDTPQKIEQHRAMMAFFNGGPTLTPPAAPDPYFPKFNPVSEYWRTVLTQYTGGGLAAGRGMISDKEFKDRASSLRYYSWFAVPSRQVLEYMVRRAPQRRIAKVGALSGYWWTRLLEQLGADVVSCDDDRERYERDAYLNRDASSGVEEEFFEFGPTGTPTAFVPDYEKVAADVDGRALLLFWPPKKEQYPGLATFLDKYRGDTIFFVGEVRGATLCMMEWVEERKHQGWVVEEMFPIPTWPGLRDKFMCFSKAAGCSGPVHHRCKFSDDELYG